MSYAENRPKRQGIYQWLDRAADPRTQSRLARELERRDREGWGENEPRHPVPTRKAAAAPQPEQWPHEEPLSAEEEEERYGHTDTEEWSQGRNMDYRPPEDHGRLF